MNSPKNTNSFIIIIENIMYFACISIVKSIRKYTFFRDKTTKIFLRTNVKRFCSTIRSIDYVNDFENAFLSHNLAGIINVGALAPITTEKLTDNLTKKNFFILFLN